MFDASMMISRRVWSCHPGAILINREIQNGRHHAFIKNDIYLKVIELETSYWCQTIYFWYQGIIWNCAYCVTLLENPIWLANMWNNYFVFPSAVKYVSKWMLLMINWQKYICISLIRKKTNTGWHLFIIMKTSNYINYIYTCSYTNYIYYWYKTGYNMVMKNITYNSITQSNSLNASKHEHYTPSSI